MLIDYIGNEDLIRCQVDLKTWQQVIYEGCRLLEKAGYVTDQYAPSIIKMTQQYGPYFVLMPRVAMPHSSPQAGVNKKGISIITLKQPVKFGSPDNDPVSIIITLAATDNKSHINLMQDLVEFLSNQNKINQLEKATAVEQIRKLLSCV